jgi:isocitrate dehydrogenase kinase/phosphatase
MSGNTAEYRIALIQKIGSTKVLALESLQTTVNHDIVYLKRIKSIFTRLLKQRSKHETR